MIAVQGLTQRYGFNTVLQDIHLEVDDGAFVTLVGPNGAGKSTLLRIVATLLAPSAGSVKVGGWPLPRHADRVRRHIGLVSHHSLLYGDLSAEENLLFVARLYGLGDEARLIAAALERVGLRARRRDPVRTFSRGMLQRLTLARATLHQPDVLLLDEPYTGLDQEASELLDDLLRREQAAGRTILMITHDLTRGLNLCDRIVILNRGHLARDIARSQVTLSEFLEIYHTTVRGGRIGRA